VQDAGSTILPIVRAEFVLHLNLVAPIFVCLPVSKVNYIYKIKTNRRDKPLQEGTHGAYFVPNVHELCLVLLYGALTLISPVSYK